MAGLQEDYDARQKQVAGVVEMSEQLLPELRPPDKLTLTDQLTTLKTQYTEVRKTICCSVHCCSVHFALRCDLNTAIGLSPDV